MKKSLEYYIFYRKQIRKKIVIFLDFRMDPESHQKKWIRNTVCYGLEKLGDHLYRR